MAKIEIPDTPLNRVWAAQNLSNDKSVDWIALNGRIIIACRDAQHAFEIGTAFNGNVEY